MGQHSMVEELGHLKNHVTYPATRAQVVETCNKMSDMDGSDASWFEKNLPEGTYRGPSEVLSALLTKV
jgi:hypothetical protein